MRDAVSFLHSTNYLHTLGGMQQVIRTHLDFGSGADRAIAFRDQATSFRHSSCDALGLSLNHSISSLRQRYRASIAQEVGVSIHHNCWGIELIHDLDPARAKVAFLHSDFPAFERFIRHHSAYCDVFVNINPSLHKRSISILSHWPEERFVHLNYPVDWPDSIDELRHLKRPVCRIGIAGRIKREQKRLDRLPAFLDECDKRLGNYELEILGTGDFEAQLRQMIGGRSNVHFLGRRHGRDYWDTFSRWRYILFLSDYEGTPLSMLEAAGAGVVPVYPDFFPGLPLPSGLLRRQTYTKGDPAMAAETLQQLEKTYAASRRSWLEETKGIIRCHNREAYLKRFAEALNPERLAALPSKPELAHPPRRLPAWLPLCFYNWRMKRLRFGYRGVIRHD